MFNAPDGVPQRAGGLRSVQSKQAEHQYFNPRSAGSGPTPMALIQMRYPEWCVHEHVAAPANAEATC
jgi:hypothetical protein